MPRRAFVDSALDSRGWQTASLEGGEPGASAQGESALRRNAWSRGGGRAFVLGGEEVEVLPQRAPLQGLRVAQGVTQPSDRYRLLATKDF